MVAAPRHPFLTCDLLLRSILENSGVEKRLDFLLPRSDLITRDREVSEKRETVGFCMPQI